MSRVRWVAAVAAATWVWAAAPQAQSSTGWKLVGWNDLGMHCMDRDFSVFSLLPPYNTIHAQLLDPTGRVVTSAATATVTYEAVADPQGSINRSSSQKTNFWQFVGALFRGTPAVDTGLTGSSMPGGDNTARPMAFDASRAWFTAEGIPLTPYDDDGRKNPYPMMRLVARNASGAVLASTNIVLPVSDEMDCAACHRPSAASASMTPAEVDRLVRLNILFQHDSRAGASDIFAAALTAAGYNPAGLYATAFGGTPILCARCHLSNALAGSGMSPIMPLTQAIHGFHATVVDPDTQLRLDAASNRTACYRCHPGSLTKCLRGTMGAAVGNDGRLSIQCQDCHGSMSAVGASTRSGWFDEPTCQSCHTGTAVANRGSLRFTSVFDGGVVRQASANTFATTPNVPANGLSLYRFSSGHGGLQCEACHGSTHAEFVSSHANDNVQSIAYQGHAGPLAECDRCHASMPSTVSGGPHGLHPLGQTWVRGHSDAAEHGASACQACHGADYRGTVLSRARGDRTLSTEYGTKVMWQGFQVGCYACHNGPGSESRNPNRAAVVANGQASVVAGGSVTIPLQASDPDGSPITLRIVSQPLHGTAGVSGTQAVFYADAGFSGDDTFTVAAWDGSIDSALATVTVHVTAR